MKLTDKLWPLMIEIYGHQWSSTHGEVPSPLWETAIDRMNPERFQHGMDTMANTLPDWPPSLPVFLKMCEGIGSEQDIRRLARIRARREVEEKVQNYSPFRQPMTYDQMEDAIQAKTDKYVEEEIGKLTLVHDGGLKIQKSLLRNKRT